MANATQNPFGLGFQILTAESAEILLAHETAPGDDRQFYHGWRHSFEEVPLGVKTLLNVFGITDLTYHFAADLFGRLHDWVQRYKRALHWRDKVEVRVRERGPNETQNASVVAQRIKALIDEGFPLPLWLLSELPQAIALTAPDFSAEHGCIVQPEFLKCVRDVSPFVHACVSGDVLYGALSPRRAIRGIKLLIQEEELQLRDEVAACKFRRQMTEDRQKFWRYQLNKRWFSTQPDFWRNRKKLFLLETEHLRAAHSTALDHFAQGFDTTADTIEDEMVRLANLPLWDLLRELGKFEIPFGD